MPSSILVYRSPMVVLGQIKRTMAWLFNPPYELKFLQTMSNNSKVIGALLVGAAAGAVLGILFAPEKGEDTRKKIMTNANDLADGLKDRIVQGKDLIDDLVSRLSSKGEEFANAAKEQARTM